MTNLFDGEKYREASEKAIEFIKRQMNVNNYSLFPVLKEEYGDYHTEGVIASVKMPEDAAILYPTYIYCDQFYDEMYSGICSGKHQNLGTAAKHVGIEVTTYTDALYRSNVCALHEDGTWHTEMYYKETDYYGVDGVVTKTETYWYRKDVVINESGANGIKGFSLKYYDWLDEDGSMVDVDHLPDTVVELFNQDMFEVAEGEIPPSEHFMYAKTYTLRPRLVDDTVLDDAVPRYADYTATLFVFADVEYDVLTTNIQYDGKVGAENLPDNPEELPDAPSPFIRDVMVQPSTHEGEVIVTWTTNFTDACTVSLNGVSLSITGQSVADGYQTYHVVMDAPLGGSYTVGIEGKGIRISKDFQTPDNLRFLVGGDPQIINEESANVWYQTQTVLDPLPTLIISMGDQVDSIGDPTTRAAQFRLFTAQQSVPVATVRGNHDNNEHYFGHFGLPNAAEGDFSFLHKGVLFIGIDSNNANCQFHIDYINEALKTNEFTWAILLMHHSLYASSKAGVTDKVNSLRKGLSDFIVNTPEIALVLAGHEHYLARTTYPGKLFFTVPTCTGSKYYVADNPSAVWNQVVLEQKRPWYTVMDVSDNQIVLTTYDYDGAVIDTYAIGR